MQNCTACQTQKKWRFIKAFISLLFSMTSSNPKPFDISKCKELQEWVRDHPKLADFLSFEEQLESSSMFFSPRKSKAKTDSTIYSKYITQLKTFLTLVQHEKDNVIANLTAASSQPIMKVGKTCFENSELNMQLHQICFVYRQKQQLELELSNLKFSLYTEEEENAICLINFFQNSHQIIPPNCLVRIKNGQFFFVPYPSECTTISFKIDSLVKYFDRKAAEIEKEKLPTWVTTFSSYYDSVVSEAGTLFNKDLCYIPMIPGETYIEKAIYAGFCDEFGIKEKIDEISHSFKTMVLDKPDYNTKPQLIHKFIKYLIDAVLSICNSIKPTPIYPNQQSISLLIFFRIVFDRLYENFKDQLFQFNIEFEQKINELSKLSLSLFNLPKGLLPNITDYSQSIGDVFRNDEYFKDAIANFEFISFFTNPIDQLYIFHNTIQHINGAMLMHKQIHKGSHNEPQLYTSSDCLCFDDLFILLLGILVASNSPEFASTASFLKNFSPTFCLSNVFEYAQAGIESMLLHITQLDINEFKNKDIKDSK